MKHLGAAGVALAVLLAVLPAAGAVFDGVLLSSDDYVYLATQGVERDGTVLQKMSPKELRRLHWVINDQKTADDPQARTKAVLDLLMEFKANQHWETENPGSLWDLEKRKPPGTSRN